MTEAELITCCYVMAAGMVWTFFLFLSARGYLGRLARMDREGKDDN